MSHATTEQTWSGRARGFVKITLVGGVVFLAPVLILIVLLGKATGWLRRLAKPLGALFPLDAVWGVLAADGVVVILLVLACFGAGLLARVSFANTFIKKAETGVLWRIPGYGFIKGLTATLDKSAAASAMHPVLVHFDDYAQLAFEVDRLADGRRVIYVPSAPDPRAGSVMIFDEARVEAVGMSFLAAIASLRSLGKGCGPLLARAAAIVKV
jgi:uncharacterized membrane protein